MLIISYIGDQVWLMTSRQTDPDLHWLRVSRCRPCRPCRRAAYAALVEPVSSAYDNGHLQLINVGVEDAVNEADAGRLVGVGVGQFNVNLPKAALEWS